MLYTGKGDKGDTTHPAVGKRVSKTDPVIEALGAVDELNSWVGYCRTRASAPNHSYQLPATSYQLADILHAVQQDLFIIQAELVGMKKLEQDKVQLLEQWIAAIEAELPPIKTFFLPGGTEYSALLDCARTVSRRAVRAVVRLHEVFEVGPRTNPCLLANLNRLSSLFYALTRFVNHRDGVTEESPTY